MAIIPYVAYQDFANGSRATVQKFSSGSWTVVGTEGFSAGAALYDSIVLDSTGTPYVAYRDGGNGNKATVKKFYAGSWTVVGTAGFSASTAAYTSLAIDSTGTPYVAYKNPVTTKATVQKLTSGAWTVVGAADFSTGAATYLSLVIDSTNTPYVAYQDGGNGNKATVQKFEGGSWTVVGAAGFSAGSALYTDIWLGYESTSYTVTYDGNTSTSGSQTDNNNPYTAGVNPVVLGAGSLLKTNYVFKGWNTEANGTGDAYLADATISNIQANVTLYAQWTLVIITGAVTIYDADDGLTDNTITFTEDLTVEATGDLFLNVPSMGDLEGDKIITIKPQGKIHLAGGHTVTVLDGTKGKIHT